MTDVVQVVQGGDHVVMRLVGDIDMANVDTVAQAINDAIAEQVRNRRCPSRRRDLRR